MKTWDPDRAVAEMLTPELAHLKAETNLDDAQQTAEMVTRIFREHAVEASLSIIQLANHAGNERIRLDAAKYVVEKATDVQSGDGGDPLFNLVKGMNEMLKQHDAANPSGS